MTTKEMFNELIKEKGYSSICDFSRKNNIDYSNMNKRINGVQRKIEIPFAFRIANILKVPVDDIIRIFYPEEYQENQDLL